MASIEIPRNFYKKNEQHFADITEMLNIHLEVFSKSIQEKIQSFLEWKQIETRDVFEIDCDYIDEILSLITDIRSRRIIQVLRNKIPVINPSTTQKTRDKHAIGNLRRFLRENLGKIDCSFGDIKPSLDELNTIDEITTSIILLIAIKDTTCKFWDIESILRKVEIIDANILWNVFKIAKRDMSCWKDTVKYLQHFAKKHKISLEIGHSNIIEELNTR